MKRYRIANRRRFIVFVTAVILFTAFTIMSFTCRSTALDYGCRFTEERVSAGDTLWEIAKENGRPGEDIRLLIHEICELNGVSAETLRPGQKLLIPGY